MKKLKLVIVGCVILLANKPAKAINPGINYYTNEQTKSQRQKVHTEAIEDAADRYNESVEDHLRSTNRALRAAMLQESKYRRMLRLEEQYYATAGQVDPYPQHDWHSESVHAQILK